MNFLHFQQQNILKTFKLYSLLSKYFITSYILFVLQCMTEKTFMILSYKLFGIYMNAYLALMCRRVFKGTTNRCSLAHETFNNWHTYIAGKTEQHLVSWTRKTSSCKTTFTFFKLFWNVERFWKSLLTYLHRAVIVKIIFAD